MKEQLNVHFGELIKAQLSTLDQSELEERLLLKEVFRLFNLIFEEETKDTNIHFTTLFSRIAYVSSRKSIPSKIIFLNHSFRKRIEEGKIEEKDCSELIELGIFLVQENIELLTDIRFSHKKDGPEGYPTLNKTRKPFRKIIKVVILEDNLEEGVLVVVDQDEPHLKKRVIFNENNQDCFEPIKDLRNYLKLPVHANLIDVSINNEDDYLPQAVVLIPDFLVNITAVAEGFKPNGKTILNYINNKFLPFITNLAILKGNVSNHMLDELVHDPKIEFKQLLPNIFKLYPEQFAMMDDYTLRELLSDFKLHYSNLKKTVENELEQLNINKEKSFLEPSFYSRDYGFQGRLDLFHKNEEEAKVDIIELKSGKIFKPNAYKINHNHFVQTLLYGLLIDSAFPSTYKPSCYILYSSQNEERLRFAPLIRKKQLEAINHRNRIIFFEKSLQQLTEKDDSIFEFLNPINIPDNYSFIKRDAIRFWQVYQQLDQIEKSYYINFISFLAREYHLSKTGEQGIEKTNGLASLWLDPLEEKQENFNVLSHLVLIENQSNALDPILKFNRSEYSNRLSKFRKGDIVVLYPYDNSNQAVLHNQVFKCNVLSIADDEIVLRLRFQQKNPEFFERYEFWNIEYDVLDSSYNASFHNLFSFLSIDKTKRDLILGRKAPKEIELSIEHLDETLTKQQRTIVNQIINCKDYFLLWGPPGTGKTSFMLRHVVSYLYHNTNENILLLSFTNRSVDEMCAAVSKIDQGFKDFIRMGSRYSTSHEFQDQLLINKVKQIDKRSQIVDLYQNNRIFLSTVASALGKKELFKLKEFDTIIIDEASQILEPALVGLLPRAKRFIMIGDHKQLPAVVVQSEEDSNINNAVLTSATGLKNMRISLFERLYKQCELNNWDWAFGILTKQGRMHSQIMKFSSDAFYEGKLEMLRSDEKDELNYKVETDNPLLSERIVFVETPLDKTILHKTNAHEATSVVKLIEYFTKWYEENNIALKEDTIGVITPFRAQIANIINALEDKNVDYDKITIDTVERYQGSARDRIIISFSCNSQHLLDSMTNLSEEGVDRKLNVALTRSRKQIVIFGNEEVLSHNNIYKSLINYAYKVNFDDFYKIIKSKINA